MERMQTPGTRRIEVLMPLVGSGRVGERITCRQGFDPKNARRTEGFPTLLRGCNDRRHGKRLLAHPFCGRGDGPGLYLFAPDVWLRANLGLPVSALTSA